MKSVKYGEGNTESVKMRLNFKYMYNKEMTNKMLVWLPEVSL